LGLWGALFRAAGWEGEGRRRKGLTWWMLLAGDGLDEDLATEPTKTCRGAALLAQPSSRGNKATSPQERGRRERERERERWGAAEREGRGEREKGHRYKIKQPN